MATNAPYDTLAPLGLKRQRSLSGYLKPSTTAAPPAAAAVVVLPTDDLAARVAALSRASLEALVLASARDGVPVPTAALAPPAPSPRGGVELVPALTDADVGPFARLADELVGEIMTHLPAVARHGFTSRLCKSLRAVGARLPWTTVVLEEKCAYRKRPDDVLWITPGADFAQIASCLRASKAALTTLSLTLKDAPSDAAAIVALLRAAPALTDLTLGGKKISSAVTKPLLAMPLPSTLRRFTLGYAAGTSETTLKFLGACTQLEHLGVCNNLAIHTLKDLVKRWRDARGGGEPLLESLALDTQQTNELVHLRLATLLPGLRALKLHAWHDALAGHLHLPTGMRSLTVEMIATESKSEDSWSVGKQYRNADTAALVRKLLAACPRLATAELGWYLHSKATEKKLAGALPLGDGLVGAPASLIDLTLVGVRIVEVTLEPLLAPGGPALRALTFRQCVVDAPNACKALRERGVEVCVAASAAKW